MHFATAVALLLAITWPQFGRDSAHTGKTDVAGQPLQKVLVAVVMDPFVSTERALFGDDLLVHYAVPIIDGDDVFVEVKAGVYTPRVWETQTWGVQAFRWEGSRLVQRWTATSDWKPVPFTGGGVGPVLEPVFQPILANGFVYMPGAGGSVLRVNRDTGLIIDRLGATQPLDPSTFVSGPLVADSLGNIYYNVITLAGAGSPWTTDIRDAWLTRIDRAGVTKTARYVNITIGAPVGIAQCLGTFADAELPWPPSPNAVPGSSACGSQRPGINVAPAIAPDGTIYTVSRAHLNSRWAYLIALNGDLTPKWSASLRDRFNDGCNVLLPPNGTPGGCRAGAFAGVDPADNTAGAGRVLDDSSSSPLIAPDGTVFYGAQTRYNYSQGHLTHFSAGGEYLGAYPFGWDITPAIDPHDRTYSLVIKENHYEVGSYCNNPEWCPAVRRANDPISFFVTRLNPSLRVEWQMRNPNTLEWCVNGPAIDRDGISYMNAEDGFLYSINPDGTLRQSIQLTEEVGQAYTPLAIDDRGRVYAEKAGILFVVGSEGRRRSVRK
jgi:hypothetical protein